MGNGKLASMQRFAHNLQDCAKMHIVLKTAFTNCWQKMKLKHLGLTINIYDSGVNRINFEYTYFFFQHLLWL